MPMEEEGGDVLGGVSVDVSVGVYVGVCVNGDVCMCPSVPGWSIFFHGPSGVWRWEPGNSDPSRNTHIDNG